MSTNANEGLRSVEFRCPMCTSDKWGTEESGMIGRCRGDGCTFRWNRRRDFRVFVRKADGRGFRSPVELEAQLGAPTFINGVSMIPPPRQALVDDLHDLLCEAMVRPPTVAIVERWSTAEKLQALRWASAQILADLGEGVPRVRRPPFIEDGAATA